MSNATYADVEDRRADLEAAERAYLRRFDWQYTSVTPGCYWLWVREFNGKTVMVPQAVALQMTVAQLDPNVME